MACDLPTCPYLFITSQQYHHLSKSSPPEVFLGKGVLKICSKFIKGTPMSKCDFNKVANHTITLRYGCSPVNLLHIFRTTFPKNNSEGLLLSLHVDPSVAFKLVSNNCTESSFIQRWLTQSNSHQIKVKSNCCLFIIMISPASFQTGLN